MSVKHPIIAITGSSGAGTTSVMLTFEQIFRREGVNGSEISVSVHDKLVPTLARVECEMIKAALQRHHGRVNAVAKALGISRKGLYLKRQRFGL